MGLNLFQKTSYAMMRVMGRVMPSCKDISALVSQGMDTQLPVMKRFSIRLHVSMCSLCRRYEKQLHMLREGTTHYANPDENEVEESLSPEAVQRLKATLDRSGK